MSIAERIYETVKNMPEAQAAEVLDFAEYVKAKHPTAPSGEAIKSLLAAMPDVGEDGDFARPRDLESQSELGKTLRGIRQRAIAKGMKLQTPDGILDEIRQDRGETPHG